MIKKLSQKIVREARAGSATLVYMDEDPKGLGLAVQPSGTKSYFVRYSLKGRPGYLTLGDADFVTLREARATARGVKQQARKGIDPQKLAQGDMTVGQFVQRFYLPRHVHRRLTMRTIDEIVRRLNKHVLPRLGEKPLRSVAPLDIAEIHSSLRKTPVEANRTLAMLSSMFRVAENMGVLDRNPAKGVRRYAETPRDRFLNGEELRRLAGVLDAWPVKHIADVVRLLLYTGCSKAQILQLRWSDVDLSEAWIRSGEKSFVLNHPAMGLLYEVEQETGTHEYVFPELASRPDKMDYQWRKIREAAGLPDARLNDLRHTYSRFATYLGVEGKPMSAVLGHASYEYLTPRTGVEAVGAAIQEELCRGENSQEADFDAEDTEKDSEPRPKLRLVEAAKTLDTGRVLRPGGTGLEY